MSTGRTRRWLSGVACAAVRGTCITGAGVGLLLTLAPGGCAARGARGVDGAGDASQAPAAPYRPLRDLASRQAAKPDARAIGAPALPGLSGEARPTPAPDDPRARLDVDAALASLTPLPVVEPSPDAEPPDPRAVSLYIAARAKMLEGRAAEALRDLEAAAREDPRASAVWREQGEALLALGRRASAMQAFRRAVDLGLREPRTLWLVGREEIRAGRDEAGAACFAAARSMSRGPVVTIDLGEALGRLGFLRASRDVLEEGLQNLRPPTGPTRDIAELGAIFRRRGELWMRVVDLSLALGEEDRATRALDAAADAPGVDQSGVLARRVDALLRAGKSAQAALLVLGGLVDDDGRVNTHATPLLAFIARETSAGPALGESAPDALRLLGGRGTPTTAGQVARAVAAALPEQEARRVLEAHLASGTEDVSSVRALLDLYADAADGARALAQAARARPLGAATIADGLMQHGRNLDEIVAALGKSRDPAGVLLAAVSNTKLSRPQEALRLLASGRPDEALDAAWEAARAGAAIDAGDDAARDAALASLASLAATGRDDAAIAYATSLAGAGRWDEALRALHPVLREAADHPVGLLLLGAELHARSGDVAGAEALVRRAVAADRYDERGYEALLAFHSREGTRPDERALAEAARALRDALPDSRVARLIAARELASRALWPQADAALRGLMPPDGEDPVALGLLVSVWEESVKSGPELATSGREWLRARLASRPRAPSLVIAAARVDSALGDGAGAEASLASFAEAWPMGEVLRTREQIVRGVLQDPERADELAMQRLARGPRTFDAGLELAELHLRRGRAREAADALERAMPEGFRPTEAQSSRVLALLGSLRAEVLGTRAPDADRMFELALARGVALSPQLQITRVMLIAAGAPDDTQRLIDAIDEAGSTDAELKLGAVARVARVLADLERPGPVLRFLPRAAGLFTPVNIELLFEWFRLTVVRGTAEDVRRFVDEADPGVMFDVLEQVEVEVDRPDDPALYRGALAYYLGVNLSSLERTPEAIAAYRRALELDPSHAWTMNNLGYVLLETGGDIAECERLIERAHELLPGEHNVTDSLAWVRYLRGHLEDRPDAPGAVSLLRRAVEEEGGDDNPTILDHYADALWRVGRRADALVRWRQSRQILDLLAAQADAQRRPGTADNPVMSRLRTDRDRVREKIEAAENGREPGVAPMTHAPGVQGGKE
ncbi:MAG: tetratricopeptide repeat protein [Planctomycetota bacterium]|nr:tetratricopeptide repeat protein [Planctomycetota bacterium]